MRTFLAAVLVTALVGCGEKSAPQISATGNSVEIVILDYKYQVPATVMSGDAILLVNNDAVDHNLMLLDDSVGVDVSAGETVSLPLFRPGEYPFHCHFHVEMMGTLVVQ